MPASAASSPSSGAAALDLLDPQPGEHILDVGCGDGTLTRKIIERGATVVGIDNSPRDDRRGPGEGPRRAADGCGGNEVRRGEFDAAFSNATLHWVLDKERAARAIWFALKPGGRFAGEMGGEGNLAKLREALDDELVMRGYGPPTEAGNWYPSPEEFAAVYEAAGFERYRCPADRAADTDRAWRRRVGHDLPHAAGSTAPECPKTSAPRSPPPSPTASAPTSPIMSAFASS